MALCPKVSALIRRGDGEGKLLALNSFYGKVTPASPPGLLLTVVDRPVDNGQPVDDATLKAHYALRNEILVKVS